MAVTNRAGETFAASFVQIHAEHNKLAFNHRFRILQNAFIRDMNRKIADFNTPSAPQRQKELNLHTEIRALARDQQKLAQYANALKVNMNHMRKVANALTVMSESRTPAETRVKAEMSFTDNTPDDVIRAAPGAFGATEEARKAYEGRIIEIEGVKKRRSAAPGRYVIVSVSEDGAEAKVRNLDGTDAGFRRGGAGAQPAKASLVTPPIFTTGGPKEMTFINKDGKDVIKAAPGTFDAAIDGKIIKVGGAGGQKGEYGVTGVSEDGGEITVQKKNGGAAGFPAEGAVRPGAKVRLDPADKISLGPGGLTFINGGRSAGDDTITADPAGAPEAFKDFAPGDKISVTGQGVFIVTSVSADKNTVSVRKKGGGAANLETGPAGERIIRKEPVVERMAFKNNGKGADDSVLSAAGAFEGFKKGEVVVLFSHKDSPNKGEFKITGVAEDFSEIFVRSVNGDDAGFINEKPVRIREVMKKPAASTVSAEQAGQFAEARDLAVKHLKAVQQQVHPKVSDGGLAARVSGLFKKIEAMEITPGETGAADGAPSANRRVFEQVVDLTVEMSNAQLSATYILSAANTVQRVIRRKSRDAQAELHNMTGVQQAEAAGEIHKLRQKYATVLDAISHAYDAQAKLYNELAVSFSPRRPPVGSVLNMFS